MRPSGKRSLLFLAGIYGLLALYVMLLLYSEPVQRGMLGFFSFFSAISTKELGWIFLLVYIFMAIGNSTNVPLGIPAVYLFAPGLLVHEPFWLLLVLFALVAGLGAATGEIGVYAIGRGAARVLHDREGIKNLQYFVRLLTGRRSLTPVLVFLFGLTPLPDQLLIIPLGVARYPIKKIFFPCSLGKATFSFIIAVGATVFKQPGPEAVSIVSLIQEGVFLAIVLTILVACVSINWQPVLERYSRKALKPFGGAFEPSASEGTKTFDFMSKEGEAGGGGKP